MTRHHLLCAVSVVALTATANAADMSGGLKEPPYIPAPFWGGFYIGVNGGGIWSEQRIGAELDNLYANPGVVTPFLAKQSLDLSGGFGGGQIGFNWQRERLVYGIEVDIQGASINQNKTAWATDGVGSVWANGTSELDWFGSVRGRLGITVLEGFGLAYITAGVAFGGVQDKLNVTAYGANSDSYSVSHNNNDVGVGYIIGAGFEYSFSPAWSVKLEYSFFELDFEKNRINFSDNYGCYNFAASQDFEDRGFQIARIGINYHFLPAYQPLK
jgi:outer membrane immunogenic protein